MLAILIGLPTWYVIGILVNFSNRFATALYGANNIDSGKAIMYAYAAIAIGDITDRFCKPVFRKPQKSLVHLLCTHHYFRNLLFQSME